MIYLKQHWLQFLPIRYWANQGCTFTRQKSEEKLVISETHTQNIQSMLEATSTKASAQSPKIILPQATKTQTLDQSSIFECHLGIHIYPHLILLTDYSTDTQADIKLLGNLTQKLELTEQLIQESYDFKWPSHRKSPSQDLSSAQEALQGMLEWILGEIPYIAPTVSAIFFLALGENASRLLQYESSPMSPYLWHQSQHQIQTMSLEIMRTNPSERKAVWEKLQSLRNYLKKMQ